MSVLPRMKKLMILMNSPIKSVCFFSFLSVICSGLGFSAVKPNPLFTDGAVLQRNQMVPVWGTAKDGEKVIVEFEGQKLKTTAKGGQWRVDLKPLKAGGPFRMQISGENTIVINNLMVGEVWVCSGQSNMEYKFKIAASSMDERPKANYPKLRMFTVKRTTSPLPLAEADGAWIECSPETVDEFSAVGYFFARDLHEKLGVPIGMIHSSWGGTPAQAWTSIEGFNGHSELAGFSSTAKMNAETFAKTLPEKPLGAGVPSVLYNGMIAPVVSYAIKGVIWYQGESNANNSKQYQTLFPAMIADWRTNSKQGPFPFFFVQIAPFKNQPPEIREAQLLTLTRSENTAMAVTTDIGDANNIHPDQKQPVGERLALAARALVYGEKIEYSGPIYQSMQTKGGQAELSFTHVGGGLIAKGGDLTGFTIAGADGKFIPAKALIKGDKVIVSADEVKVVKAVRFGWANVPEVNLFNQEGLPASPFRTDLK